MPNGPRIRIPLPEEIAVPKPLTQREIEVLELMRRGITHTSALSAALGIGTTTIKGYIQILFDKAGVDKRRDLIAWWEARRGEFNGQRTN
jgi:DNA-binding CsgD family transcriptional regulator